MTRPSRTMADTRRRRASTGRMMDEIMELARSLPLTRQVLADSLETATPAQMCFASMFVRQVRQCFSAVWADGFPRCRHRFPVM